MNSSTTIQHWNIKVQHVKKIDTIKEIHRLETQIQTMEREKNTHIYNKRGDFYNDFQHLLNIETGNTNDRLKDYKKIIGQLQGLNSAVTKFQRDIVNMKSNAAGVTKLKLMLEEVEGSISLFKDHQRDCYDELTTNERLLTHEVATLQHKYESWSQHRCTGIPKETSVKDKKNVKSNSQMPEEVLEFENFVEKNGGIQGGWDEFDHQTFIKLWNTYKTKVSQLIDAMRASIPTHTDEDYRAHIAWYREYVRLDEAKKAAIKEWRKNKQIEKELITENVVKTDEKDDVKEKYEKKVHEEKRERFSKLNAWKVQQEIERMQKEEANLRCQMTNQAKQREERQKQLEVKAHVLEYKRQKEEDEEFLQQQMAAWEEEQEMVRRQLSSRERTRFFERDQEKLNNKMAERQKNIEEKEKKNDNLNKMKEKVVVARDPSRLYKPTEGWKSRLKDTEQTHTAPTLCIPHRAIPTWRQNPT